VKILLFANTDWYLYNFRLPLAECLRGEGHEVVLVSPPGDYSKRLEAAGFRWVRFDFDGRGTNPLHELNLIRRLVRLYRAEKPDVVHHFTVKCVLYGSLAARLTGVPGNINAVTGLGYLFIGSGRKHAVLRSIAVGLYRLALTGTRVIFQNPDDCEVFERLKLVRPEQCVLIRSSGIDVKHFQPAPEPPGDPVVVLAGRMLWDKGVGEFVEAARQIRADGTPAARFVLVGSGYPGNPASIADEQLRTWEVEGVVEWLGWQEDMAKIYAGCHIVCLPSYREGLPRSLAEAAACGRPLVATDVPGCREIVKDGQNGLLVPARDPAALAKALRRLISDPQLRQRMGACSRELVVREVSQERVLEDTLKVYNSLDFLKKPLVIDQLPRA
jgi:glycosyltransferase involved in cell wall biosynthesis